MIHAEFPERLGGALPHRFFLAALLCAACLSVPLRMNGCTSFIVSGRVTKDGRPLIFKNRDTGSTSNVMVLVEGERYRYVGITGSTGVSTGPHLHFEITENGKIIDPLKYLTNYIKGWR